MHKNIKITLAILLVIIFVGAGCNQINKESKNADNNEPIKIGFVLPLTGDIASFGENAKVAAIVAMNETNSADGINGRKLDIIFEDGRCEGKTAFNAANKLVLTDKVPVMMSFCSDETLTMAPLAESNKTVHLAPVATNPKITDSGDYTFRLSPSDTFQGSFVADYIYDKLGKRRVAVVYNTDSNWSVGISATFNKRFVERGGEIVASEGTLATNRDVRSELAKIKASNPDILYAPTFLESGITILNQTKEIGLNMPVIGGDAWDNIKIANDVGTSANGTQFTIVSNKTYPQSFVDAMNKIPGGKDINAYAPRTYDAIKILAEIIGRVGTEPEKIKNELYKINYNGIADTYVLDKNGDMVSAVYSVKEFRDGQIVEVK